MNVHVCVSVCEYMSVCVVLCIWLICDELSFCFCVAIIVFALFDFCTGVFDPMNQSNKGPAPPLEAKPEDR